MKGVCNKRPFFRERESLRFAVMGKKQLIQEIIKKLEEELDVILQAANEAHNTATHEESVAENKYDTFGLEASYLAAGLSRRVDELKGVIRDYQLLKTAPLLETSVRVGAMVALENEAGEQGHFFFVGPGGAGIQVDTSAGNYKVVTPSSPIGQQMVGKDIGDEVSLGVSGQTQIFEIVAIN